MNPAAVKRAQVYQQQVAAGGIPGEMKNLPDRELVATLVAHGQPRFAAEQDIKTPLGRALAARFWADVQAANEGDRAARELVDFYRAQWEAMRREELIADDPFRQHTDLVDPSTLV